MADLDRDEELSKNDDDAARSFSISLTFTGAPCPNCGHIAAPGPCAKCGTEVPPSDEPSELLDARRKAIGPLATQARELLDEFDGIAHQHIPLSADHFVTAVIDVKLFRRVGLMPQLGHRLSEVNFDDPKAVGRDARRLVSDHLDHVRELLGVCQELAMFDPDGPAAELQDLALESGRYGARIVEVLVRAITAEKIDEAQAAAAQLQELLEGFPQGERLGEVLPLVEKWSRPDYDSRIGLALARPGRYTDDLGFPDPGRIFAAFSDADEPFKALAARARAYFGHLLGSAPDEFAEEALLVFPAATLAGLDRPLRAHRVARDLTALMHNASAASPGAVQQLVERTTAAGPLVFAAASRVQKALRHLALGGEAGLVDDEHALKELLGAYLDLVESHFRTFGALALDLIEIPKGGALSQGDQPPMLGELEQRLAAAAHPLAEELANSSDSGLRNAAGHSQYRWDPDRETVIDLRTAATWSVEELEDAIDRLVGAIAGLDAGYSCFVVDGQVELDPPDWLRTGDAPYASLLLTEATLGAYGLHVVDATADGSQILVEEPDRVDPTRILPPLAGIISLLSPPETVQIRSPETGDVLLEVDAAALVEATTADEHVKDLAVFGPLLSVARYAGLDERATLLDALALQIRVVTVTALPDLQRTRFDRAAMFAVAHRLRYIKRFAAKHTLGKEKPVKKLVERLARAEGAARAASFRDRGALNRLLEQMSGLASWAESRGVQWPPI
jgi:hypothetical protein